VDTRIFRLRNEYSIVSSADGQEVGRRLFGPVASGGQAAGVLLRNGGRLHLAAASRPEYTTPDCGSVPDLVVHDKAGERILEGLLADAGQRLPGNGERVLKASVGAAGHRYGCQEDYLIARRGDFGRLADILIPFLITRQLICGAGAVVQTPRGAVYCLSRLAGAAGNSLSSVPVRPRPFINSRDEPGVTAGLRRLRVAVSEPNMSETTTALKAGATDLVLRMAEAGAVLPGLILDNPVRAIGEICRDLTGRTTVLLADGRQPSALDIQREYLTRAKDFTERRGPDAVSSRVLGLWERALDAIGAGNLDAIAREIDWVIKYQLIERFRAEHGVPLSAPQVGQADLAYHDIRRDRGLYYQAQRGGAVERTARDIDIFEAKTVRPAPGRYRQAG
jgi:proteasome accessory factor A